MVHTNEADPRNMDNHKNKVLRRRRSPSRCSVAGTSLKLIDVVIGWWLEVGVRVVRIVIHFGHQSTTDFCNIETEMTNRNLCCCSI